ncbi:BURP domain-containing protein 3 [Phalaenopsis equestris]|uniref:BURP domain-containing protein 3 n=1 Tax=Phalaenopsis equestris TaxID=78828 RepID=UPI0009E5122F|nr:BURP domain-containing protein 3 [Phalaenopsis equestris]
MDLLLPLLSSMFLFIMVGEANHPSLEPQVYWRTILPNTPMPSAIAQLLQPDVYNKNTDTSVTVGKNGVNVNTGKDTTVSVGNDGVNVNTGKGTTVDVGHGGVNVNTGKSKPGGTTVGVGKGGVDVHTGKGTSVNVGHGGVGVQTGPNHKPGGTTVNVGKGGVGVVVKPKGKPVVVHVSPFVYNYAASDDQLHDAPAAALFFLRRDLRPGKSFNLKITDSTAPAAARFIPRSVAKSVPFSTAELPSILTGFSIPEGSSMAAATKKTLSECAEAAVEGERKLCATSLESMVDFATESLGTREVVAVATEGGAAGGEAKKYEVGSVRKVAAAGGKGVVACHSEAYAYAVFFCHATAEAEVYEVEMVAAEGGGLKAVAVCHTDTGRWNPKHLAFRVLKVRPGSVPVCHFLPRDHVVWAAKA